MSTKALNTLVTRFTENKKTYQIKAFFQLEDHGQKPYFSVTGEINQVNYAVESCGMLHDEIAKYFPEMQKYLKWHLTNISKGPMYYIENSRYWMGYCGYTDGKYNSPPNYEYAKSTIVYGTLESDYNFAIDENTKEEEFINFLNNRFNALMQKFDEDMMEIFGKDLYI